MNIFKHDIFLYIVIGVVLAICLRIYYDSDTYNLKCIISNVDGNTYCVRERAKLELASDLLAKVTQKCKDLVKYVAKKYPDDEDVESSSEKVKKVKEVKDANPLYKKNIVMTGARNKELIDKLKEISVNIATTVNKNTFALIAKDKTDSSTKIEDATKLNIPIFSIEEFKKIYF